MIFSIFNKETEEEVDIDYVCVGWSSGVNGKVDGATRFIRYNSSAFPSDFQYNEEELEIRLYLDLDCYFNNAMGEHRDQRIQMIKDSYFGSWLKTGARGDYFELLLDIDLEYPKTRYAYRSLIAALVRNPIDYSAELAEYYKALSHYKNVSPTSAIIGFSGWYSTESAHQAFLPPAVMGGELRDGGFIIPQLEELKLNGADNKYGTDMWTRAQGKHRDITNLRKKHEVYSTLGEGDPKFKKPAYTAIRYANYALMEVE